MLAITSVANPKVQYIRKLADKKFRDQEGVFLAEGRNLVKDIPDNIHIVAYYVSENHLEDVRQILRENVEIVLLSDRIFNSVSDTVTPQGVIAIVEKPKEQLISANRLMVLDGISDSGNLGTIIRTASATGYKDIVLLSSADPFSPKSVRSSMGGVFSVRIHQLSYEDFLNMDYPIYLLDMAGENIFEFLPKDKFALVVGSEAKGASEIIRTKAEKILSLPMESMESLNASISASVAMYVLKYSK